MFRYADAAPQLEIIFYIREKLVTICHVSVMECLIELVACLAHMEVNISKYFNMNVWNIVVMVLHNRTLELSIKFHLVTKLQGVPEKTGL